jgi:hypothetical protein
LGGSLRAYAVACPASNPAAQSNRKIDPFVRAFLRFSFVNLVSFAMIAFHLAAPKNPSVLHGLLDLPFHGH